jgi:hypothetical protein
MMERKGVKGKFGGRAGRYMNQRARRRDYASRTEGVGFGE